MEATMFSGWIYDHLKPHAAEWKVYFRELLASNPDIHEGLRPLLRLCRETVVRLSMTPCCCNSWSG
jgi:hypothetical protein